MHIFITGGTGLIGTALIHTLLHQGHIITVLTRDREKAEEKLGDKINFVTSSNDLKSLDEFDAVINLAGEPIAGKRWTKKQKERLCSSRWDITRKLTELIKSSDNPPSVFISGSAVGYYGAQNDEVLTETSEPNEDFTNKLCTKWESLAIAAENMHTRVCILRTGIVLSRNGGMLPLMSIPFKMGLGSILGSGKQYISWIHIQDMVNAIVFLLNTPEARGIFNMTAPHPVTNRRFSNVLSAVLYRPRFFRIPSSLIKLALGESATMLIDGQRAIPQHLIDMHYSFAFEDIDDALAAVLKGKKHTTLKGLPPS